MRTMATRWIVFMIACLLASSPVLAAHAQEQEATPAAFTAPEFGLFPIGDFENPWFDVTLAPSATDRLTAGIRNSGTVDVSLKTYATNAINPPNGGFAAGTDEDTPAGPTLWVDYPATAFALEPGEERAVDFTVTVPSDTPAGEYFVALVVQTAEPLLIPGAEHLRQVLRNTVSVEITVPGEMTSSFELGTPVVVQAGTQWVLDVPITNTGTVRLRPAGTLVVTTPAAEEVVSATVEMGSFYGGLTTSVRVTLPEQLPPGAYLVTVDLTDNETGASATLENVPIQLVAAGERDTPTFMVEKVSVTPNADPLQFATVSATIVNNGPAIPTANVTLNVQRDGALVESYPLAQNQALPSGESDFSQRYIPVDGWQEGSYSFQLVITSIDAGTETVLSTIDIADELVVP